MEKWANELLEALETASEEAEKFVSEVADETLGEIVEFVGDLCELVGEFIPLEDLDRALSEVLDLDVNTEDDGPFSSRNCSQPLDELGIYIAPNATVHPACRGCRHYYGYAHNGNLLVCGMHPYGCSEGNCPDWEGDSPQL